MLQTDDRRQTDDRQTDGRTTTFSEHEREFTFTKNPTQPQVALTGKVEARFQDCTPCV